MQWNGKLLALWEGGLPHELDPVTLETIKESDWDKQIEGNEFAAHYRVTTDASTGERRFVNFGAGVEGTDANIKFYEFNEQGERVAFSEVTLPGAASERVSM
jgi:all-trans-8'-apo-beta-carotenal 15,15'-oxygenase